MNSVLEKIGNRIFDNCFIRKLVGIYNKINSIVSDNPIMKKFHINGTTIFCTCFLVFYIYCMLLTTMIKLRTTPETLLIPTNIMIVLFLKIILFDKYNRRDFFTVIIPEIIFGILLYMALNISYYSSYIIYYVFIIAARNVDFRKVALLTMSVGGTILVAVTVMSQFGIITDLVYNLNTRHSFGFIYPTDYAAHVFFLTLTYFWYRKGKLKWFENLIILAIAGFLLYFCRAKLDSGCIILMVIFGAIYNCKYGIKMYYNIRYILIYIMPVAFLFMLILSLLYNENSSFMQFLDKNLFINRLHQSNMMLFRHGVTFWGQYVADVGYGGSLIPPEDYTFIDISYIRILIKYGIFVLVSVISAHIYFVRKRVLKGDFVTAIVFLLITINCMMAHHLIDFSYNIFFFIFFAKIDGYDTEILTLKDKRLTLNKS